MTIKLLTPRDLTIGGRTVTYPAGALVTLDSATETGLINSKEATATLTGGITYTPPTPSGQPVPVMAIPSPSSGGVGNPDGLPITLGSARMTLTQVAASVRDPRTYASGTGSLVRSGAVIVGAASGNDATFVTGKRWYVSNVAANGMPIGSDANSGKSKLAPFLTLTAAHAAADANGGDVIIVNDSATPYDGGFSAITKPIMILPLSYRGATLKSTVSSATLQLNANNITIGAFIVDSALTAGGYATYPIQTSTAVSGCRVIGAQVLSNGFGCNVNGPYLSQGVEYKSVGAAKLRMRIDMRVAGDVRFEDCTIDGYVTATNGGNVQPATLEFVRSSIKHNIATAATALSANGFNRYLIDQCDISCDGNTAPAGVVIVPNVNIPCSSLVFSNNRMALGITSSAAGTGSYLLGIGNETAMAATMSGVRVFGNDMSHADHGLFFGYCLSDARAWGNVVRDVKIGIINKGGTASDIVMHSNIIVGGTLTGGGIRTKMSSNAQMYNNLVIFDADSVAAGVFQFASDGATNARYYNNIIYAPGKAVVKAVQVDSGCTASFAGNDYYAGSFAAGAFNGADALAAWLATEPTALGVDPLFVNPALGDFRLSASSPLKSAGASVGVTDFYGGAFASPCVGPLQSVQ